MNTDPNTHNSTELQTSQGPGDFNKMSPAPYNTTNTGLINGIIKKKVTRVGVLKCGLIQSVIGAVMGLIVGIIYFGMFSMGGLLSGISGMEEFSAMGAGLGIGMGFAFLVFIPILYAIFGFIGGAVIAAVFNLAAGWVGGIDVQLEDA